jgi:hypothetical protein
VESLQKKTKWLHMSLRVLPRKLRETVHMCTTVGWGRVDTVVARVRCHACLGGVFSSVIVTTLKLSGHIRDEKIVYGQIVEAAL